MIFNDDPQHEQHHPSKLPVQGQLEIDGILKQVRESVSFRQWMAKNSATFLNMIAERPSGSAPRSPPGTDEPGKDQELRSSLSGPVPRRNPAEGAGACTAFGPERQRRLVQDDILPMTIEYPEGTILLSDGEFQETDFYCFTIIL